MLEAYKYLPKGIKAKKSRVVLNKSEHKLKPGDGLMKYDKTIKIGKTVIHIVSPGPMTEKEVENILDDYHNAGWEIINETLDKGFNQGKDCRKPNKSEVIE